MEIAFFTEMLFDRKISRNDPNLRTEFAWMVALDAHHYNLSTCPEKEYDLGILILPKKLSTFDFAIFRQYCNCKKIAVMQEGPNWYWQDYDLAKQIWYFNTLSESDILFVHNESDKQYYKGLTSHGDVRVLPSLMIEESIGPLTDEHRSGVMIGGNFCSWYGGFDSFIVAQEFKEAISAPSMGRRVEGEEQLIQHLPYLTWKDWMHQLNKVKYGIHLMRTHAAGTFALNCAYLGIPCIGYRGLDTQQILHPDLTVEVGDLVSARKLAQKLMTDEEFYLYCSIGAKERYQSNYTEEEFKKKFYAN